jgi:hypothetical protein
VLGTRVPRTYQGEGLSSRPIHVELEDGSGEMTVKIFQRFVFFWY